ncbi:MAG TPA: response regulator [Planctomycetaceae bacterium]|nr:response regulator [Planctomycetaceae bacterium]
MTPARILIVEDEAVVALDLRQRLIRLGYDIVETVGFGEVAVELAREHRPDLVLMDIRLRGTMDGIEAAETIRTQLSLPVIFLTAHADDETVSRARVAEPFGYILKPFDERELWTVIEMALYKHQAEQKLRESEQQLRQAQKMEAIGQLSAGIAHDFNNMLTVILNYTSLLMDSAGEDHPWSGFLSEIQSAGQRSSQLTRQLMTFCRQRQVEPQVLDLNQAVVRCNQMLRRLISENIQIHLRLQPNVGNIRIDPGQFEQILFNLSLNARDAMPEQGRLIIETGNAQIGRDDFPDLAPGAYLVLRVKDDGEGIPEEIRHRIFEPFFTTKEAGEGTGLGLATAWGITKQNGGHMDFETIVGQGTSFIIYLPAVATPAAPRELADLKIFPNGTETILLVEDEPTVRLLSERILSKCGYTVLAATDGADAVRLAELHGSEIDLVVTDVVMPIMGAKEMVQKIRMVLPNLRVLFMSGYNEQGIFDGVEGVVAAGYLSKPFSVPEMAHAIRRVLDKKTCDNKPPCVSPGA